MSQQELDEVDKIIEEIIVFSSVDYSSLPKCIQEAKKHFPMHAKKGQYIFHSLRNRMGNKFKDTRRNIIEGLREDILNGHREDS